MMKKTLLLCAFLVGLVSSNVMALTLDEARTQGRVGETFYGYLVALKTDAETEKLVTDINAERKASYQQLAKQNNVFVDDIAKLAGQKLVARAKPGEYVQGINGKWVRKF
ncbi:YdbL family protein [Escherichia coli]|nr:YdbL family protein [Escherichia coli]MDC9078329.1 YdbL family protein [Escherichia coli]NHR58228.1 YdbL family protein [Escherichia coli]